MANSPYLAYLNISDITEELYKSIVGAAYTQAVKITEELSTNHGNVITDVVARLTQEEHKNLMSFVYQLWNTNSKIVKDYLPAAYNLIFSQEEVTILHKKYNMALKMDANTDSDGDRLVWGDPRDKTSRRVSWKILPVWENNRVHFKIKDMDCGMFLKMGLALDDINDRKVFGAKTSDGERYTWYLSPIVVNGEYLFFILNRQFEKALKLAVATDYYGDRQLWGHNADHHEDPYHFAWKIKKYSNN